MIGKDKKSEMPVIEKCYLCDETEYEIIHRMVMCNGILLLMKIYMIAKGDVSCALNGAALSLLLVILMEL